MRRPRARSTLSAAFVIASALFATPGAAGECDWPGPGEAQLSAFLNAFCYSGWTHDSDVRDTGPWIAQNPSSTAPLDYGVHPASRIFYSDNVVAWLKAGRPEGGLEEPAMIVKEMYVPPAGQYADLAFEDRKTRFPYWTVMLRDVEAVADGWYWLFGSNESYVAPSGDGAKPQPAMSPFEARVTAELSYPDAGFGNYCTRCHASAVSEQTFSTLENIEPDGNQVTYLVVSPAAGPGETVVRPSLDVVLRFLEDGGAHAEIIEAPLARQPGLPEPLPEPDPEFLETFKAIRAVPTRQVEKTAFPPETFDHAYMPPDPNPHVEYITSDQCIGCHDATVGPQWNPPMLFPDRDTGGTANLSPYGEWRASMMGLAGRDPIFFAQLESERQIHKPIAEFTQNLCLSCHGAMGQRQFHADRPDATCEPGDDDPEACFLRDRLQQYSTDLDENAERPLRYAALGREGISCAICHHISPEGLGTPASFTGNFKVGPSTELYGPYDGVKQKPMQHGLGIDPVYGKQLTQSKMCGSCHTIYLPVYHDGKPVLKADGEPLVHPEQTTYVEWLNSDFQDETPPVNHAVARSCQSCHMPRSFQGSQLAFTIAAIEDDLYPFTHNRLPDADIAVRPRTPYSRHTLLGINQYGLEMFAQFPLILGIRTKDPMVPDTTQLGLVTAIDASDELAKRHTADVRIDAVDGADDAITAEVSVTNKAGHKFPSGVGFRRAFLNVELLDAEGAPVWASGRTNRLGVILGGDGEPLKTEFYGPDQQEWEPHFTVIDGQDQVQIYELIERDFEHQITTSFLALYETVKDNRLVPRGWRNGGPHWEDTRPCTWDEDAPGEGEEKCVLLEDSGYADGGGFDRLTYRIACDAKTRTARRLVARLYYQAIPPSYLHERFSTVQGDDTKRLYYLASRLNTAGTNIENWKLLIDEAEVALPAGGVCGG